NISVPAIFTHATEEVKRKVLPDLLRGTKRSCLCITEPDAGSDVANLTTEAKKGKNAKGEAGYFLSGTKKWITNGFFADYYVVACRTGGKGGKGISLVLAEHNNGFVDRHKIETQGMRGSGSSLINFDELFVPASHILGRENDGFKGIVSNFNHERLAIIYQALRLSRVVIEDCMSWAHQRETFGVKLIEHAVIRQKLGVMSGRVEALQAWVNDLAYQYKTLPPQQAMIKLGGPIATCKAYATQTMELCAREGSQIFGGLSYTRGGKGGRVERIYREVRAFAIPGGSE
ncbi:acyl-CoA dehydrogenase, partial [Macrococcus caseolyticus]